MATIAVKGRELRYLSQGDGPPLLGIMGLAANLDFWSPAFIAAVSARYRLILFDNRGMGPGGALAPGRPRWHVSIAQLATDAVDLLQALGLPRAHVLGVSMGGMIALQVALAYPQHVDKLVLACTSGNASQIRSDLSPLLRALLGQLSAADGARLLFSDEFCRAHPEELSYFHRTIKRHPASRWQSTLQLLACRRFNVEAALPTLKAPTLVLSGDADRIINYENSQLLAARIPGAQLQLYRGAGHGFIFERQEEFLRDLGNFLA